MSGSAFCVRRETRSDDFARPGHSPGIASRIRLARHIQRDNIAIAESFELLARLHK
jgi:hypothetical protein